MVKCAIYRCGIALKCVLLLGTVTLLKVPFARAEIAPVGTDTIIQQSCSGAAADRNWSGHRPIVDNDDAKQEWVAIDPMRPIFFAIVGNGQLTTIGDAERRANEAFSMYRSNDGQIEIDNPNALIFLSIANLQNELFGKFDDADIGLKTFDASMNPASLWHSSDSNRVELANLKGTLRCKVKRAVPVVTDGARTADQPKMASGIDLSLRGVVDDLFLTGKERKKGSAAELAVERVRSFADDGSRKQVTTLTAKAVIGWMILPASGSDKLAAYVGYELNRPRSKPSVAPELPATLRDGDTELLKLGVVGSAYLDLTKDKSGDAAAIVTVDTAYLFDVAHNAERLRGRFIVSPYLYVKPGGLCGVRYFAQTFIGGLRARCQLDVSMQQNIVTKEGRLQTEDGMDSILIGGKFSYDLMVSGDLDAGIVAGASLDYQRRIYGGVPHVRQHRLYLKYRIWSGEAFGLELGPELIDGINPESFEDENKVVIKAGIIF
jgi:hypothetical protein